MSDVAYEILVYDKGEHSRETVIGYQVGRFAVRHKGETAQARNLKGEPSVLAPWLVDHIPTGIIVIAVHSFSDAMVIADDVSRFSKNDPDSDNPALFFQQVGSDIIEWLKFVIRSKTTISFRAWRVGTGKTEPKNWHDTQHRRDG